jgi:hypothetical protein
MNTDNLSTDTIGVETAPVTRAERILAIRLRLPGQAVQVRVDMARAAYGPLYTMGLIRERVAHTLPTRLGYVRTTVIEPLEEYRGEIPDDALLKFEEAQRSGLFTKFWVLTPTYYRQRQVDPWMVGEVAGSKLCAVIASWDNEPGAQGATEAR